MRIVLSDHTGKQQAGFVLALVVMLGLQALQPVYATSGNGDSSRTCSANSGLSATNKVQKTFDVGAGSSILLDTESGNVEIQPWSRNKVQVVVELKGSETEINRFDLKLGKKANIVTVRGSKRPRAFSFSLGWTRLSVRYTIKVPRHFDMNLRTVDGDILASGVDGNSSLETESGDVEVRKMSGRLSIRTGSGKIKARQITGDLRLQAGGGDVVVINAVGSVDVGTSRGDIVISRVKGKVAAASARGDIQVTLAGANQGIQLNAKSGNIDIFLSGSVSGNIDAHTKKGEVKTNFSKGFRGNIKDRKMNGALNGGGSLIKAVSHNGDITIRKK